MKALMVQNHYQRVYNPLSLITSLRLVAGVASLAQFFTCDAP